MSLLRKPKEKKKKRGLLVATHIEDNISSFLSLYCTAFDVTKAAILKEALDAKIQKLKEEWSEEDLADAIARLAKHSMQEAPEVDYFFTDLRKELNKKGIDEDSINRIILNLENGSKKKKKKRKPKK